MKFTAALVVLATLATAVIGAPLPNTNAERLARGLNPNPPVVRRNEGTPAYGMLGFIQESPSSLIHIVYKLLRDQGRRVSRVSTFAFYVVSYVDNMCF